MVLNHFCHFCILKQNEMTPIGSKHIVWATILDDFESVLVFLHLLKQNEIALISSKYIVRAMILDNFESGSAFLHF